MINTSLFIVIRYLGKSTYALYIIMISILRIFAMKNLTKTAHIAIRDAWVLVLYEFPALLFRGQLDQRCIYHGITSHYIPALTVSVHIFGINLPDLTLSIYIVLIDIPR